MTVRIGITLLPPPESIVMPLFNFNFVRVGFPSAKVFLTFSRIKVYLSISLSDMLGSKLFVFNAAKSQT